MRKVKFINGEYYHIYNRGVDKRDIFLDKKDIERFLDSVEEFNDAEVFGSLYIRNYQKERNNEGKSKETKKQKLVEIVAYCCNPNHYHFILRQKLDNGISRLMHKIGTGYAQYFNLKYDRKGSLFQGSFKAVHIDSDIYLNHLSVYVNLNFKVHRIGEGIYRSSWQEYVYDKGNLCDKKIILSQFDSPEDYKKFALFTLDSILQRKDMQHTFLE